MTRRLAGNHPLPARLARADGSRSGQVGRPVGATDDERAAADRAGVLPGSIRVEWSDGDNPVGRSWESHRALAPEDR